MISKELLAQILGDEYKDRVVEVIQIEDNYLRTYYDCGSGKPTGLGLEYNLYELAHLAKQWALNKGYLVYSVPDLAFVKTLSLEYCVDFGDKSETENIFRACQWILDNKAQQ